MKLLALALLMSVFAATGQAQQVRTGDPLYVGVAAGAFDYFNGTAPYYPMISARVQKRFLGALALEGNFTAVAATEVKYLCAHGVGSCDEPDFTALGYPGVGAQLRLPRAAISPYLGGSVGLRLGSGTGRSLSREVGLSVRIRRDVEGFLETRWRTDRPYRYDERSREFSVGFFRKLR